MLLTIVLRFVGCGLIGSVGFWERAIIVPYNWECDLLPCSPGGFWFSVCILVTFSDGYTFLFLLRFTLREWATAVMIIVVFDAMIMGYLSMVYISSSFFITNKAMLMSYDDSSFVLHLSAISITQAMIWNVTDLNKFSHFIVCTNTDFIWYVVWCMPSISFVY